MCGIVGAVAQRDVAPILLEGLKRLEYRGYDSAGIAVIDTTQEIRCIKKKGKVTELEALLNGEFPEGGTGIAHTRWATHGKPDEKNTHPHCSGSIALVHNGIIENHRTLREQLIKDGYKFFSDTDSEVIAHLLHQATQQGQTLLNALQTTCKKLKGAYSIVVIDSNKPNQLYATRNGSPLVVGIGIGEHFVASDPLALQPVTRRFVFIEENDIVEVTRHQLNIYDAQNNPVERAVIDNTIEQKSSDKGTYRHYMLKEIFEQPDAITDTLEGCLNANCIKTESFGLNAEKIFEHTEAVQIVACGTSFHAGIVARYWLESFGIPCQVEIASEFRYRKPYVHKNTLFVTITQSGETADTLAALKMAQTIGYKHSLTICNVATSSIVRASNLAFLTKAGAEIGVASTKAFTTQLTALLLFATTLARCHNKISADKEAVIVDELRELPQLISTTLELKHKITQISEAFSECHHSLFLGRGTLYPIAMEGALKLKEISYIHAEAYAAGELKHGPLALVDDDMPVVVIAPNNELLDKLKSNMEEVQARGGKLYVFADCQANMKEGDNVSVTLLGEVHDLLAPILYTIPLQLLSYYVALIKGTDIDQPRNLAKSVTVE